MSHPNTKQQRRFQRRKRARAKISGTSKKPRLTVYRSTRAIYLQLIDDQTGHTILAQDDKSIKAKTKLEKAESLGKLMAASAAKKGIKSIVFDRNGYLYHGRVAAVAKGFRAGGVQF